VPNPEPDNAHEAETLPLPETTGSTVLKGRYFVGRELGRGGFATTYLATDSEVASRKVVVKILNDQRSEDSWSLKKFRVEMEALALIDHPNVVGVIDFGESEDHRPFLVMQFVPGVTLRSMMARSDLTLAVIANISRQMGRALTAAHEAGVIHRDIKPENIMVRETRDGGEEVKLIDFGVSSIREAEANPQLTKVCGTFRYMAPEQFDGDFSPASDIYQMGVVAYEMVTGKIPFQSPTPGGMVRQQLDGLKVLPTQARAELPTAAEEAILRAMSLNPAERFRTAREFGDALSAALVSGVVDWRTSTKTASAEIRIEEPRKLKSNKKLIAGGLALVAALAVTAYFVWRATTPAVTSVAVLPFANRTGDAGLEYLTQGITESLIDDLSSIPTLRVSARGSVMKYEGQRFDARAAGRELGVTRVIDGSVSKRDDGLFVDTELIEVGTGARLWGRSYMATLSSISNVLQQFSNEATDQLRLKLSGPMQERIKRQYAVGSQSYEQYLKARFHLNKRTASDFEQAIRDFNGVIAKDPDYAPAYSGLAATYALMGVFGPFWGGTEPVEAWEKARAAAKHALQLDGTLADAYGVLAMVEVRADYAWAAAERNYQRAIQLNPNSGGAHENYALELAALGRFDEALREIKLAEEVEKDNSGFRSAHGLILYMGRRYDNSLNIYHEIAKTPEGMSRVAETLAMNYWMKSLPVDALKILNGQPERFPELQAPLKVTALARLGRKKEAQDVFDGYYLHGGKKWWYHLAVADLNLGRPEEAIRDLEKAYEQRWGDAIWIGVEPLFDELRSYSKFTQLLQHLKLPAGSK
jgi:eukaryotic-like serine/threonine-protein kinase